MNPENVKIEPSWREVLAPEFEKPYFDNLTRIVRDDYHRGKVYPPASKIFAAFDASPFYDTKVVIIGQDPYHGPGQANGLAFSVNPGVPFPPSLRNIFTEVASDTGSATPDSGDLSGWARQGVLLLNTSLTVREGQPKSHAGLGWENLTDAAVRELALRREGLVFMLWGSDAIRKSNYINPEHHLILTSPHPSPLSAYRGFFGNHHFSKANEYLTARGLSPIIW